MAADIIRREECIVSTLGDLFLTFARIGLFTFGGGYAMIPLMEHTGVEEKGWITHEEMMEILVIAESTPGPIAINGSTYVGYRQRGFRGALVATTGMVLPSFVILLLISLVLDSALTLPWVAHAFLGIRVAVGILIVDAALRMMRKMERKPLPCLILGGACAAMLLGDILALRVSSIVLMLLAGAVTLSAFLLRQRTRKEGDA